MITLLEELAEENRRLTKMYAKSKSVFGVDLLDELFDDHDPATVLHTNDLLVERMLGAKLDAHLDSEAE